MTAINIEETKNTAEMAKQLPEPKGYRVLCLVPQVATTFGDSGLVKPDETVRNEEITTVVLFVVALGPDAYKDMQRFPSGPYCKKGDFVIARAYAGTRLNIHGQEFRLLNDDSIEAVVEDPRGIRRA